jgi:uncharacterized membrane protein YccC
MFGRLVRANNDIDAEMPTADVIGTRSGIRTSDRAYRHAVRITLALSVLYAVLAALFLHFFVW